MDTGRKILAQGSEDVEKKENNKTEDKKDRNVLQRIFKQKKKKQINKIEDIEF